MATADTRLKEVVECSIIHGSEKAKETYGVNEETLSRYKRTYKQKFGEASLIGKIRDKFSDDELSHLLSSDMSKPSRPEKRIVFEGEDFNFLVMTDTHIGSVYFNENHLLSAFDEGKKQGCTSLLHSGDILEGMAGTGRPGQIYELSEIGYAAQRNKAVELFKQWGKPMYFCLGNHDMWLNTKAGAGIDVGEDLELRIPDAHYLGIHEGALDVHGAKFMLWHGEDSSSYATSYRISKVIEAFTGGEKPAAIFLGHVHKQAYIFERNVHAISSGCLQAQSGFMRYKRLAAHLGFWIIRGKISNGEIKQFTPTWYPFYR